MTETARSRLAAKLRALRAKTMASGCTEAEAMAAAELAAKLMAEHGLSPEEVEMTEATAREETVSATWRSELAGIIAYCTNTAVILDIGVWRFIGRAPGPEIGTYLLTVCVRAVNREVATFKASTFYRRRRSIATKRQALADFRAGLVLRLARRLVDLFGPTISEPARDEAKGVLASRFTSRQQLTMPERETRYSEAASQGWRAGGKVPLHHGVGGSGEVKAIEGGRG